MVTVPMLITCSVCGDEMVKGVWQGPLPELHAESVNVSFPETKRQLESSVCAKCAALAFPVADMVCSEGESPASGPPCSSCGQSTHEATWTAFPPLLTLSDGIHSILITAVGPARSNGSQQLPEGIVCCTCGLFVMRNVLMEEKEGDESAIRASVIREADEDTKLIRAFKYGAATGAILLGTLSGAFFLINGVLQEEWGIAILLIVISIGAVSGAVFGMFFGSVILRVLGLSRKPTRPRHS